MNALTNSRFDSEGEAADGLPQPSPSQSPAQDRDSDGPDRNMAGLLRRCLSFARAVVRYAGRRGAVAAVFVGLGAVLEGFGVLLLVPLLATLFNSTGDAKPSGLASWAIEFAPGLGPLARLSLILAAFGGVMILRALVLWRRDVLLGALQVGFLEAQRRSVARRLAGARWEALAKLGHGRVTHVLGSDIQRCAAGVQFLLLGGAAVVMLIAQGTLAFVLSPVLAILAGTLMTRRRAGDVATAASLA